MALNPYTLNHLYEKGILNYVPTELMMGMPMGTISPMTNPYIEMAKQGGLYKNHGIASDTFTHNEVNNYTPAYNTLAYNSGVNTGYNYGSSVGNYNSASEYNYNGYGANGNYGTAVLGSRSQTGGLNLFNGIGIGAYNQSGFASAIGENGIAGSKSPLGGMSAFNGVGIGSKSQAGGLNAFGGYADVSNHVSSGFNQTMAAVNRTPKFILGIIAGIIGFAGISAAFKSGKKPKVQNTSFWSKLNPVNWFKSKK